MTKRTYGGGYTLEQIESMQDYKNVRMVRDLIAAARRLEELEARWINDAYDETVFQQRINNLRQDVAAYQRVQQGDTETITALEAENAALRREMRRELEAALSPVNNKPNDDGE